MGNSMSDTYENLVLNHLLGVTAWTPSASSWIALFTTPPTDTTTGVELAGGGYARVAVQNNNATNWPTAVTGTKTNSAIFEFPTATTAWGNVSAFAIMNAVAAGECIFYGTATTVRNVASGDVVRFPVGSIVIELN